MALVDQFGLKIECPLSAEMKSEVGMCTTTNKRTSSIMTFISTTLEAVLDLLHSFFLVISMHQIGPVPYSKVRLCTVLKDGDSSLSSLYLEVMKFPLNRKEFHSLNGHILRNRNQSADSLNFDPHMLKLLGVMFRIELLVPASGAASPCNKMRCSKHTLDRDFCET